MKQRGQTIKNKLKRITAFAIAGFLSLAVLSGARAEGADTKHLDETRSVIEKSSLTGDEKKMLSGKADHAVAAGVPGDDVTTIVAGGLKQGVSGAQIAGFLETATTLKEQNLPVRLVLERIELGLARGVPAERVALVTRKLAGHVAAAKPIAVKIESSGLKSGHGGTSDETIETMARALEKSIPAETIMRTGEKVQSRNESTALFDRALVTMSLFVGNGMKPDQASRLVHTGIDLGYSERDFEKMESYMTDKVRKNTPMNEVYSGMSSMMERGTMHEMYDRPGGGMMGPGSMGGSGSGMMNGNGGMMR